MGTLNDTLGSFFGDEASDECTHCETDKNLVPFGSATAGAQTWICKACKARHDVEQREREQESQAEIDRWVEMDRWEE